MRVIRTLMAVGLAAASLAHAEGVEGNSKGPSTDTRLRGVQTMMNYAGGMLSVGGAALRHLPPGARKWTTLHQSCANRGCSPVAAILAYEISEGGVGQRTLLDGGQLAATNARAVRGSNDERVVLVVMLSATPKSPSGGAALLRWRYGDAKPDYRPYPRKGGVSDSARLMVTKEDELIELNLVDEDEILEVRRYPPGGNEQVLRLQALQDIDAGIYGMGIRNNGKLWLHWGDHLALFAPDKPPRSFRIEPLLVEKRSEWAGADIYVKEPEGLWVGIDGRGRDFARVSFEEAEKLAKPWPSAP